MSVFSNLEAAADRGDVSAQMELARLFLVGRDTRRDLKRSRDYFARAAANGDRRAIETYRAFVANGTGAAPDWRTAVQLLRSDDQDADAREQLSLISAMEIDENGLPLGTFDPTYLSDDPQVIHFPRFLDQREALYLIRRASERFRPSTVVHPVTGMQIADHIRTSSTAAFPLALEQPAIHAINLRIALASNSTVSAGEPLTVLRYDHGQQYRLHLDTLTAASNQRAFTMLLYLNDDYTGGETHFPKIGLTFKGRAGDGLLIRNLHGDGTTDDRLLHEGRPVSEGLKFLASRWIRQTPLMF